MWDPGGLHGVTGIALLYLHDELKDVSVKICGEFFSAIYVKSN
jgi:hypothetical protein